MIRTPLAAALAAALLALPAQAVAAEPQPYGHNDAGGFRNVLPPGQTGHITTFQLAQNQATGGGVPEHYADQLPLYTELLYASPTLQDNDIPKYFKDATFGVRPEDVERTYSPRPGLTVVRDKQYGVPRIYGDTDEDVVFGAGYVAGEDRLFFIDVLRHYARAELSTFAGGDESNRKLDHGQWSVAPYTEADLQRQIDMAPVLYGSDGERMVRLLHEFVAGINAYIAEARLNPNKMPAEYAALQAPLEDFKATDVIAEASLIGGIFGKGGGDEVGSAQVLNELAKRFGPRAGRRAWADFRSKNDPEAPTTLRKRFPYQTTSPFAKRGLALPDHGSTEDYRFGPPLDEGETRSDSIGAQIHSRIKSHPLASNWELVSKRESASGHAIGVLGPQVGYYIPQVLMEQELHGPSFDARGTSFPGVNLMVQIGRGRDYAWSATTAYADNVDTFAEVLCEDESQYLYRGSCRPFEKLEQENCWKPNPNDRTPPGCETLTALRSVHGIVYAHGTVKGKKVAYVRARTTYFHEADSAIGFFRLNDPNFVKDPQSFRQAIGGINFLFNWAYVDADNIAYQLSGWLPKRAKGTSPDFPVLGTGEYDWRGFDPELKTMRTLGLDARPHAVNPRYLVSWNNKQAPGFAAADDKFTFGPVYRSQMIEKRVRRAVRGPRKMSIAQLVQSMEEPATQDIRGVKLVPVLAKALDRHLREPRLREAMATLRAWSRSGAHRRDLDKDGRNDDEEAIRIMDAWWPKLVEAQFAPALGEDAMAALRRMTSYPYIGYVDPDGEPSFSDGWWGFVHKDLRGIFTPRKVRGRWSRGYCGRGRPSKCRRALLEALGEALKVSPEELYGHGKCEDDPTSACWDMIRWTVAAGISLPPIPMQNRPTFQQTVEVTQRLPR